MKHFVTGVWVGLAIVSFQMFRNILRIGRQEIDLTLWELEMSDSWE